VTTYTVVNARGRTVLPASDAATAALYRRIFDDKHGQGSHRVVLLEPEVRTPARAPPLLVVLLALPLLVTAHALPAWAGSTERVSVSSGDVQAQGGGGPCGMALSADGRFVVFGSWATDLVPGDTNGVHDEFVHDRQTHTTELVSIGADGAPANNFSCYIALSATGRYVAFRSSATNLVKGDTSGVADGLFVRDRTARVTTRVSVSSSGVPADNVDRNLAISADGRYVAFGSSFSLVPGDTNGTYDVFVRDRQAGTTERVSLSSSGAQGNGPSLVAGISSNGRYVSFASDATNLVRGDTNGATDIFVRDRQNKRTERVSVSSGGVQGNLASGNGSGFYGISSGWITGDGHYVIFFSEANNLVPGDTNGQMDVFVRNRQTHTTERVNISSNGAQAKADGDPDGDGLAPGGYVGQGRTITQDGRYVTFFSTAANLAPGDTNGNTYDVYVRDRVAHVTTRVNISSNGIEGESSSYFPTLSGDGSYILFNSPSANLVPGDTNGANDVFVRTR
jgi:archaellum component FlaF (FlaF/FlaG flagellin family)